MVTPEGYAQEEGEAAHWRSVARYFIGNVSIDQYNTSQSILDHSFVLGWPDDSHHLFSAEMVVSNLAVTWKLCSWELASCSRDPCVD